MRGFSRWVASAAKALERWAESEAGQSRRDRALLAFLKETRELRAQGAPWSGRERLEALLESLAAAPAAEDVDDPLMVKRSLWEPLARLYPGGECWRWAREWARERQWPLERLGASPGALFERAAWLDAKGAASGARLGWAALELGLGASDKGAFEERGLTPLGRALKSRAPHLIQALRDRGARWEECGLPDDELALRCKDALWPEPIEALAARGARLTRREAAPALDLSAAIEGALKRGSSREQAEERALRCARALLAMGAGPNEAPAKGEGARFPLEGALAARCPRLCQALLEAGADPEDARVKGRLARAGGVENSAAEPIEREIAKRRAERDERYALWGMYQRGELFGADGARVSLADRLATRRSKTAHGPEAKASEPSAPQG